MAKKKIRFEYPVQSVTYAEKQKRLPDDGEQVILATMKNGTTYMARRKVKPLEERKSQSAAVLANNTKFKKTVAKVNEIMADIDQLQVYRTKFIDKYASGDKQYSTLRGFIFAEVYKTIK